MELSDHLQKRMMELYLAAYQFAKKFYYLPYGCPTPGIDICPSVRFPSIENSADSVINDYAIVFNKSWMEKAIETNFPEFEFIVFHELRHFHQRFSVNRFFESGLLVNESKEEIESWNTDFQNYKRNSGDAESREENVSQTIERDANAYALSLLQLYHINDGIELNLGLPPVTSGDLYRYQRRPELKSIFDMARKQGFSPAKIQPIRIDPKVERNAPCPCGSGKKYKKCICPEYHAEYRET